LAAGLTAVACAAQPPPPATNDDPKADAELAATLKHRDELRDTFLQLPLDQRKRCEISAGDCRMDVADARDAILRAHVVPQCRAEADSNAEMECVAKLLPARGEASVAAGYFKRDSWCLQKLLACSSGVQQEALEVARKQHFEERKQRIESSPEAVQARALAAFAEEKTSYLRSVLPPQADGVCADLGRLAVCEKGTLGIISDYQRDLNREEETYDERATRGRYEAAQRAKAECHEPEFACLTQQLDSYGGTQETRGLIQQSLAALKRREVLLLQAGEDAAEPCLNQGVEQHQRRIVDDYQRFVKDPVLFFQAQLHKDFRSLYEAQAICLQAAVRRAGGRPLG